MCCREEWKGYLIETFKLINGIYNYDRHFFNISPQNLLVKQIFKTNSINQLDFFAIRVKYKLPNQIKNSNRVKKIKNKLNDFKNNSKKRNLKGYFWELLDELLNKIWSVCRYCIDSVYVLCKDSFFFKAW